MPLPLFIGIAAAAAAGAKVVKGQVEKSKAASALIEEAEAKCAKEALAHRISRTETDLQKKMRNLLFQHAFSDSDKSETPPISTDWKHLPNGTKWHAARKYSLLSWNEYAFYTSEAIYYHNKKKGIHEFLYYDNINAFDLTTGIVNYGNDHQSRDISHWASSEKKLVAQISHIWQMDNESDTSVLEFCFNQCHDFCMNLSFFKDQAIRSAFQKQSQGKQKILKQNWDHIKIASMNEGKIELQFWAYFPKPETVTFNEDDSEAEIYEKELRQEALDREAEERERHAYFVYEELLDMTSDVAQMFQQALYNLFGVLYDKENIAFLDAPDFTYEGPSVLDRIEGAVGSVMNYASDYVERNCK